MQLRMSDLRQERVLLIILIPLNGQQTILSLTHYIHLKYHHQTNMVPVILLKSWQCEQLQAHQVSAMTALNVTRKYKSVKVGYRSSRVPRPLLDDDVFTALRRHMHVSFVRRTNKRTHVTPLIRLIL